MACDCLLSSVVWLASFNTLRPRQNGRHFADDVFKCIFLNENVWISIKISLKFVPKGPINNIPSLVQIMAWRRSGDKPLSEATMESLLTHICVTRPQWVKYRLGDTFRSSVFWVSCNALWVHATVGKLSYSKLCQISLWYSIGTFNLNPEIFL